MAPDLLLLVHAAATGFMTGLIWFVQVVHYPLFGAVGSDRLREYEVLHARRTTYVVMPVMLVELATAIWLLFIEPTPASVLGAALLGVIWGSTAFLQVPLHGRLAQTGQGDLVGQLVRSNWIRTLGWSLRLPLALGLLSF